MHIGAHRAYRDFIVQLENWASGPGEFEQHTPKLLFKMIEKGVHCFDLHFGHA